MRQPPRRSPHEIVASVSTSDRKSTRLNSSHGSISYAVFCLKKKKAHCRCDDRKYTRMKRNGAGSYFHHVLLQLLSSYSFRYLGASSSFSSLFFFLMIRRPPRSTLFPTRRSSDLECSRLLEASTMKSRRGFAIQRLMNAM